MSNPMLQLIVLAAIAIFLILRLRNVLGTRDGFEPTKVDTPEPSRRRFEVIEGTAEEAEDHDILDHADAGSPQADALAAMKSAEPSFNVRDFLNGAKSAHEMILMAFERGDLSEVRAFLDAPVAEAFQSVIDQRAAKGQTVEAQYLGTRETALHGADFDSATGAAEISVRFVAELVAATRDAEGKVIEG
ncbi:Tim44/TimA family putative adaptor protein, partial [Paracoccus sp. (in: a-proteobacteria)]